MIQMNAESIVQLRARFGVALTGGVACGKSTIAATLARLGAPIIDADRLARDAVAPGTPALAAIASTFGAHFITPQGELDRAALRRHVFADATLLTQLERITHPAIHDLFARSIENLDLHNRPRLWVYDVPLLFEQSLDEGWREIWVAHCLPETQLRRLIQRDRCAESTARDILARQWPIAQKIAKATWAISTEHSPEDVEREVTARWRSLLAGAPA